MTEFIIKSVLNADWEKELELIGFDKSYRSNFVEKFYHKNLKIYKLTAAQANILKQTALSAGADCAENRNVISGNIPGLTDVILCGSFNQLKKIAEKLKFQPFSLAELAEKIKAQLFIKNNKTKIAGILNITPDSFSDGGQYNSIQAACRHFAQLVDDGADIIDIGAESTRPGAKPVDGEEQIKKILPVLEFAKSYKIPISIDTRSSHTASVCLKNGAAIINDTSGLKYDNKMAKVIADNGACAIIQHSAGNDINMRGGNVYKNVTDEVYLDLSKQIDYAKNSGIQSIIIDPGIGFDKDLNDNFKIINRIEEFYSAGFPVMLGLSRKSMLNMKDSPNAEKDIYTLALNTLALEHRVDYIRVHNVKIHRRLIDIYKNDIL